MWVDFHKDGKKYIPDKEAIPLPNFKSLLNSMGALELLKKGVHFSMDKIIVPPCSF